MVLLMANPVPITVIRKSLKRRDCWGDCDLETKTIWIEKNHPNAQAYLSTLVHESIHLLAADLGQPDIAEEKVIEWERVIAKMLYDEGFRRIQP